MFKSDKQKELYMNDFYSDQYSEDKVVEMFMYLTNPQRLHKTSEAHIRRAYRKCTIGKLIRRLDPVKFHLWTDHN